MNKQHNPNNKAETILNDKDLLAYLENTLPADQQYLVENEMNDSAFLDEAMEGLNQIKDKQKIPLMVQEINYTLKKSMKKKSIVQLPRILINNQLLIIVTTIAILLLVSMGFLLYKMYTSF
jgi:hypothetical protein